MRIGLLVPTLGIIVCLAGGALRANGWSGTLAQDDVWAVIEYPEGREVAVELKGSSFIPEARGTARIMRSGNEATISLEVSGVPGDETNKVYIIDSLGNASILGALTISDGAGSLRATTALSKFMIVISPQADLTGLSANTRITMRSTVPDGFSVIARENSVETQSGEMQSEEPSSADEPVEPAVVETPDYDVPLLSIDSLRGGAKKKLRASFASSFESGKADVVLKRQKGGSTQIKMHFSNLRTAPEGTQYLVWQVAPDKSYTLLGNLVPTSRKHDWVIQAQSELSDFGLLITFESSQASSPAGSVVATIVN